ncbi:MAG: D-alanine--D-alanine ligase family protein [Anaerococcus sp.]|nr:D-alanine--D-alanine ligase family protein [Anaerococcus sp.]
MINVYVLCGGPSSEHDIALRSALNISNNLNKDRYKLSLVYIDKEGKFSSPFSSYDPYDEFSLVKDIKEEKAQSIANFLAKINKEDLNKTIIIPAIHGTYGEDGTIQAFLDTVGLNYIGNGLLSSAICMDKVTSNDIFEKNKLSQAKYLYTGKEGLDEKFVDACIEKIGLPLIVKPSANGSSVGVSKVTSKKELMDACKLALKYDKKVLVEELIVGQEIEFAVVGQRNPDVSKPAAYISDHSFLDYDAKYFSSSTKEAFPYDLPNDKLEKAQNFAKACYMACGCEGFARVDIFYGEDEKLYINEINTFPGFTPTSFFARLCMDMYKISFGEVLDVLINNALERSNND